jgi:hypothetical protein
MPGPFTHLPLILPLAPTLHTHISCRG